MNEDSMVEDRGFARDTSADALQRALRQVLATLPVRHLEGAGAGLSDGERKALLRGGARFEDEPEERLDPLAEGAVAYAALLQQSLTAREVAGRLGVTDGRVRQLLADRTLYSFVLDGRRVIPAFQLDGARLVPGIGQVNAALPSEQHPVAVERWYHLANPDLLLPAEREGQAAQGEQEAQEAQEEQKELSPLQWLRGGYAPAAVVMLARSL